jgi:membrane-associated phospholipid phosphatase
MSASTGVRVEHALRVLGLCAAVFACSGEDRASRLLAPQLSRTRSEATTSAVDVMATWNVISLKTTLAGPFSPPRETRSMAMVSAAIYDAVCSITRDCEPYGTRVKAGRNASVEAAVDAAAHDVLVALYPGAATSLNTSYDSALAALTPGRGRDKGQAVGQAAAAATLAMRAQDHASDVVVYTPTAGMGHWVPTPPAFVSALEPGWPNVTPFLLASGDEFRPGPPPAPGSDAYVRDYAEIASIGARDSMTRTALQTETARFWVATAPQNWNQVVRQLTLQTRMDAPSAARAYLLLNLAGADAIIAAWDAKFHYGQWRPVTAIRSQADDGSSATFTDATWTPLLGTPPFPDYPAGHTTYGGAALAVLNALFGDRHGVLSITSPASGVTHHYSSFAEIASEVENARVWGGIHWRTSVTEGTALGRRVADADLARAFARFRARGHCVRQAGVTRSGERDRDDDAC